MKKTSQQGAAHLHHVSSLVGSSLCDGARHQIWYHLARRNHCKHHLRRHSSCQAYLRASYQGIIPQDNPVNLVECASLPQMCAELKQLAGHYSCLPDSAD